MGKHGVIPLFNAYPLLRDKLPYVSLGQFPTPVEKLDRLGEGLSIDHLYIKRDDLSGKVYGGNKVRKLEFLLGRALRAKVKEILTFGFAGSNHCLATAIYAQKVGLKSISMLLPQPNAHYVRRNLLMSHYSGAELHLCRNMRLLILGTMCQLLRHRLKHGQFPQVIPPGGSSPLGVIGFVNAAFELKQQIMKGEIPEPDRIYVACGTMGTATGLMLGVKTANLKSEVVSVRVADERFVNVRRMGRLIHKTNSLLCRLDPSFPTLEFSQKDMDIRHGFFGKQYALYTKEGMEAAALMKEHEGIELEGTYTGKAFACLMHDAKEQDVRDRVVLFWNTHSSRDLSDAVANVDYHQLPLRLHRYFEEDVQLLDSHS
jgi:1-aminocyclopropane-1-carboxylate deaminase/D-cysteine desulfhydrase-like pyridoxal-dependent ACC family enzyme